MRPRFVHKALRVVIYEPKCRRLSTESCPPCDVIILIFKVTSATKSLGKHSYLLHM